jgi:3-phosphoshikimate 1-carboxyvinyltransferase
MKSWRVRAAGPLRGALRVPGDKSITHRAVMFSALARGESAITGYLACADCRRTIDAFRRMGAAIDEDAGGGMLRVRGLGRPGLRQPDGPLDMGNSGTTTRLLAGILAGLPFSTTLIGDESLSRRPMGRIMEPLRRMGARIDARDDGFLPMTIIGRSELIPLVYQSPVASAQVKSCILLAGLAARGTTSVTEPAPSRDHTERMLAALGVPVRTDNMTVAIDGPAVLHPGVLNVPGDISSAAFFIVGCSLIDASEIVLQGVGLNPTRDGVLEVLTAMGADVLAGVLSTGPGEPSADLTVRAQALRAVDFGGAIIPRLVDEIPALVLAATQAEGTTVISGAQELRVKESDRIAVLARELGAMGADIAERPDGFVVRGPTPLQGASTRSHGDHRIAMTLALAGLIAEGETIIEDVDCVDTSYPGFAADLARLCAGQPPIEVLM